MRVVLLVSMLAGLACATQMAARVPSDLIRGRAVYARCQICHLSDGVGVEGTFPPLRDRLAVVATTEAGRRYLVLTLTTGLVGEIDVDGTAYRGAMPAQRLDAADVAAVLNHLVFELNSPLAPSYPFLVEEVAGIRLEHGDARPGDVRRLRAELDFGVAK